MTECCILICETCEETTDSYPLEEEMPGELWEFIKKHKGHEIRVLTESPDSVQIPKILEIH